MSSTWQGLIGNLAVVILFVSAWTQGQQFLEGRPRKIRRLAFAAWMALGAIATMSLGVQLQPGIFFDLRATMVVVAGVLGGPLAAFITAIAAAVYRLSMGGVGAVPGTIGLMIAATAGTAASYVMNCRAPHRSALAAAGVAAGISSTIGMTFLPASARDIAVATFAAPLFLLNGTATMLAIISIVRAGKLRNERHILRQALTESPDFLYVKDLESRFIAVNRGVATHHGYSDPKSMVGRSDQDLTEPGRARQLLQAEQDLMRSGNPVTDFEEVILDQLGQEHWFLTSKLAIRDAEDNVVALVGVTRDVTRYRQLEAELLASRNLLARAMAEMSDGVAMFDKDGRLVFSNDRYTTSFPLTCSARYPGATLRSILEKVVETGEQLGAPQNGSADWINGVLASLQTGGEEQVQLFDGTWLHVRTRPGSDGSALVVVSDATTMKHAETALLGLNEKLQTLATTDGLTGLNNRRAFDANLLTEISRATRNGEPLALLLIDIDHFKRYNDTYGHVAGDDCLRKVGYCLTRIARRPGDTAARYGGEEFALVLPNTGEDGAYFVAETVRNALKGLSIPHDSSEKRIVTASIGISILTVEYIDAETLVLRADEALYDAKAAGRDRSMGWHAARPGSPSRLRV